MPVDTAKGLEIARQISSLKFFPSDPQALAGIAGIISRMCEDGDKAEALAAVMLDKYDEWPGPRTLRAEYCQKWKPADGVDAFLASE